MISVEQSTATPNQVLTRTQYTTYKDSGLDWLGKIPALWEVKRFKFCFHLNMGQSPDSQSVNELGEGKPFLQGNADFTDRYPEAKHYCTKPKKVSAKKDILISVRAPVGEQNISDKEYAIGRGLAALTPRNLVLINSFAWYAIDYSKNQLKVLSTGSTYDSVSIGDLASIFIVLPPLSEQTRIAEFLDRKTAQIDQAIAQKERLIELLNERRQVMIHQAVTHGLDPTAPMKDSGIDWIGEIPAHWEATRVKNIFQLIVEPAPDNNDFELLSVYTDIGVKPRKELEERGNKASTTDGYWLVKKGDIVVNKLLAWMGAIGLSNYDGVTSPAYDILRARRPISGEYYHTLFRSPICVSELKRHSRGIMDMRLRLYFDKFGDILVPYPPIDEQLEITEKLNQIDFEINRSKGLLENQIQKLQELKSTLINSAVTGKIKV
jgi:type I restriction enzyme S subunit